MSGILSDFETKHPDVVGRIKQKFPDMQIVSAHTCHYPLYRQKVRFTKTSAVKAGLLEEYVMKAANLGLSSGTDKSLLSRMLGMDEFFLDGCIKSLCGKGILKEDALPFLALTPQGEKHASAGTLPSDEVVDEIEYFIDMKSGLCYPSPMTDPSCDNWEHFSLIDSHIENIRKYINPRFIFDVAKAIGKSIETPDGTTRITSMLSARITGQTRTLITDIRLRDDSGKELCLVWDHAKSVFRKDLSQVIQQYGKAGNAD